MSISKNTCLPCDLPPCPNEYEYLLTKIQEEIEELSKTTEARLLFQDGKIAKLCVYIKDNLSSTIRELLDAMQLSGELDQIILTAFDNLNNKLDVLRLSTELVFNNVEDMINDKEIKCGQVVRTLGYYELNDGGGALYKIRKKTDDVEGSGLIHFINSGTCAPNGLVAVLIYNGSLNVKSVGCKEDNESNATIINDLIDKGYNLYFPKGNYNLTQSIIIKNSVDLEFENGATLKAVAAMDYMVGINPNKETIKQENSVLGLLHFRILGGIFDCNDGTSKDGIVANTYFRSIIRDFIVKGFTRNGISTRYDYVSSDLVSGAYLGVQNGTIIGHDTQGGVNGYYGLQPDNGVENVEIINCKTGFYLSTGTHVDSCTCWLSNKNLYSGSIAYRVQTGQTNTIANSTIDTYECGVFLTKAAKNVQCDNIVVINNKNVINPSTEGIVPIVFRVEGGDYTAIFKCNNITIEYDFNYILCNQPALSLQSRFENVYSVGGYELMNDYNDRIKYSNSSTDNENFKLDVTFENNQYHTRVYITSNLTVIAEQTLSTVALDIIPSTYTKKRCVGFKTDGTSLMVNLFSQNGKYILYNDTGSDYTLSYLDFRETIDAN